MKRDFFTKFNMIIMGVITILWITYSVKLYGFIMLTYFAIGFVIIHSISYLIGRLAYKAGRESMRKELGNNLTNQ